jgi:hypothetical protein
VWGRPRDGVDLLERKVGVMPKLITYSGESPAYLRDKDGNEYNENSRELEEYLRTDSTDNPHAEDKWRRRGVHVGWVKQKYVEIGVASFDPSREMPADGLFMPLDREAINNLIHALRRARDSAFGKDA